MTESGPGGYFLDYPGFAFDGPAPVERRIESLDQAIQAAVEFYADSDVGKVIVVSLTTGRRVATIYGNRMKPRVIRRPERDDRS